MHFKGVLEQFFSLDFKSSLIFASQLFLNHY